METSIRIIGSCIDDMFVETPGDSSASGRSSSKQIIFWGCWMRREDGLSDANRDAIAMLSGWQGFARLVPALTADVYAVPADGAAYRLTGDPVQRS